jgi:hypothetical protein
MSDKPTPETDAVLSRFSGSRLLKELEDLSCKLEHERNELKDWKSSALEVLNKNQLQEIGKEINTQLGSDIAEQINKAICDFVFESKESKVFLQSFYMDYNRIPVQRVLNYALDPSKIDYCNDLNAMHEAEKYIMDESSILYKEELEKVSCIWHSTTKQKAIAFLKAIGKWKY